MKLIANAANNNYLRQILPGPEQDIDGVLAAIAYGDNQNESLVDNCVKNKRRLDIWMRYDHTVPVKVPLLEKLLQHHRNNVFCRLIPDCLHSKIIWWKGYGAYIGSANLTQNAWNKNIEAGVFFTEDDLQLTRMAPDVEAFFDYLVELEQTYPLTDEIIEEAKRLVKARKNVFRQGIDERKQIPQWAGPNFISDSSSEHKRKNSFKKEWHETLTILRNIGQQLIKFSPEWIQEDTPIEWQVDQFLHAYYYHRVGEGLAKPFEEYHQRNQQDPQSALNEALQWWKKLENPPPDVDLTLNVNAPYIREKLDQNHVNVITQNELAKICRYTFATSDHVIKMSLTTLGRPDLQSLDREERLKLFSSWLLQQKNNKGWTVLQLLEFVLYGGKSTELWERLYLAGRDPDYSLPHYGLNSIAELIGWAHPEWSPPRNGRTNKALRALGYDVKLY